MSKKTPRNKTEKEKFPDREVSGEFKRVIENPSDNEIIESQLRKKQIENSALKKILNSIVKDLEK